MQLNNFRYNAPLLVGILPGPSYFVKLIVKPFAEITIKEPAGAQAVHPPAGEEHPARCCAILDLELEVQGEWDNRI